MIDQDYLIHYGVLGMKWGVRHDKERKAKERAITEKYSKAEERPTDEYFRRRKAIKRNKALTRKQKKSDLKKNQARYDKALDKLSRRERQERLKNTEDTYNRRYSLNGKETNKQLASMSTGEAIGKSLLLGSYGAYAYTKVKSHGYGRGFSAFTAVMANAGNNMFFGIPGFMEGQKNRKARQK